MFKGDFRSIKKFIYLVSIVLIFLGCDRLSESQSKKYRETKIVMGTVVHLDVCKSNENQGSIPLAYSDAWQRLEDIGLRMNMFNEKSEVSRINNSFLEPIIIKSDTYHVLEKSHHYSTTTNGAFDITVWPLIKLWQDSERTNTLPTEEQILEAKAAVGLNKIQLLDKNQVKRLNKGTKIDLGGIAKGYAIDEVARIFRDHGISDFYIDAGGDVYAGGRNCFNALWRVGIRDPQDPSKLIDVVNVSNAAVTTSGDYEQYFTIEGKQWSHIINPNTGYPQSQVVSSTVIAPKAIDADALSTALTVLGGKAGTLHINRLGDSYASLTLVKSGMQTIQQFASRAYTKFKLQSEKNYP